MPPRAPEFLTDKVLTSIKAHIFENLSGKISIDDLANIAGMKPSQFRSTFKAQLHKTPYQFVLDTRVNRARDMLATTQLCCSKVAFDCGFSSQSHMTDVFRQRLGKTPRQIQLER
ncbi:MAG: helix-turn-helix transcriptional regulator [Pseudomonadota bacterium]